MVKKEFNSMYEQIELNEETRNLCIFTVTGTEVTVYYHFVEGLYGLENLLRIFEERIDKTQKFKHTALWDDIIVVAKGNIEDYQMEVKERMKNLEEAVYRLYPQKRELFKKKAEGAAHKLDQNGNRPLQTRSNHENKYTKKREGTEIFYGSDTFVFKLHKKSVSANRYTAKITEKTKRVDIDQ